MNSVKCVKIFVKDTADLWKHQAKYMKRHWKGLVIMTGVVIGTEIGCAHYQYKRMERSRIEYEKEQNRQIKELEDKLRVEYEVK